MGVGLGGSGSSSRGDDDTLSQFDPSEVCQTSSHLTVGSISSVDLDNQMLSARSDVAKASSCGDQLNLDWMILSAASIISEVKMTIFGLMQLQTRRIRSFGSGKIVRRVYAWATH